MLDEIYALLQSGDSFQAAGRVERGGDEKQIIEAYSQLIGDLYSVKRDVPRMLLIARAGIAYCLAASSRVAADAPERAERLKGAAKMMSYNASANAWPGWKEKGITIFRSDSIIAMDLARFNLRLAGELKRGPGALTNAHWLVGAQHLALNECDAAKRQFEAAAEQARKAGKEDFEQMANGYVAVALLAADGTSEQGRKQLASAVAALKQIGGDDAEFFAQQIQDVAAVFGR